MQAAYTDLNYLWSAGHRGHPIDISGVTQVSNERGFTLSVRDSNSVLLQALLTSFYLITKTCEIKFSLLQLNIVIRRLFQCRSLILTELDPHIVAELLGRGEQKAHGAKVSYC